MSVHGRIDPVTLVMIDEMLERGLVTQYVFYDDEWVRVTIKAKHVKAWRAWLRAWRWAQHAAGFVPTSLPCDCRACEDAFWSYALQEGPLVDAVSRLIGHQGQLCYMFRGVAWAR